MSFDRRDGEKFHFLPNPSLKAGVSLVALCLAGISYPALAQDTPAAQAAEEDRVETSSQDVDDIQDAATADDVIVVTGFRQSLESAQAIKRNADVVCRFDYCGGHRRSPRSVRYRSVASAFRA